MKTSKQTAHHYNTHQDQAIWQRHNESLLSKRLLCRLQLRRHDSSRGEEIFVVCSGQAPEISNGIRECIIYVHGLPAALLGAHRRLQQPTKARSMRTGPNGDSFRIHPSWEREDGREVV